MNENHQLLEKFVAGLCTKEEIRAVNLLLGCEAGRKMLDWIIESREKGEFENPPAPDAIMQQWVDTNQPLLQQRIATYERHSRFSSKKMILRWSSVAAAFVGIALVTGVALWRGSNTIDLFGGGMTMEFAELSNPEGIPVLHELSDGTQVWLAAGSTLKYPETFNEKRRDVELEGEAFFDVARDENRLFTMKTGSMETRVLGTSFKITAFEGYEHEVAVATGKVSVNLKGEELARLTSGTGVRHDPATGGTTKSEIDPTALEQWKSGTLFFDKQPMEVVARQLENRFGIEIIFADPQIATHSVRGIFSPEKSAEDILGMLGFVGNFEYERTDDKHYTIH